jgi:4-oxalocrotonate tautomerase
MPYVNIKITDENVSENDKKLLIAGVTELLQKTLGKNPKTTMVIIDEVPMQNWGVEGLSVPDFRKKNAK